MSPKHRYFFAILTAAVFLFLPSAAVPEAQFKLAYPGSETVVDYEKYGRFVDSGKESYHYEVSNKEGLSLAIGEGLYPNTAFKDDPKFLLFQRKHPQVDPWEYVDSGDPQKDFYAWCLAAGVDEGTRLYFQGEALRNAGLFSEALKAYYALVVHFPKTVVWAKDDSFYWYAAPEAIARIRKICATHTELGVQLEGAFLDIQRSRAQKPERDRVRVWPGKFIPAHLSRTARADLKIIQERGHGRVRLVKYNDRSWELLVEGKPFFVKGMHYVCTTIGESAHALNLRPWMTLDDNKNGKHDGMFDSWVDRNNNNRQDEDEPVVGDAALLKAMGANAIRVYHNVTDYGDYDPNFYDKELMRTLNRDYGIYFIMGDFLGAYTVGSKAIWQMGTDYTDETQKTNMKESVRAMVMDHKDEPYVLMWLLGNENQHPHTRTNADEHPKEYARFLDEVAKMIHEIDPNHPVAVGNLNSSGLRSIARYAPEIDIYGCNVYSGAYTMGSIWQLVKQYYDRPVLFTEMGCDACFDNKGIDEEGQAKYLVSNWTDIELNRSGGTGEGNAIGGVVFEWLDEWWKSSRGNSWGDPETHNKEGDFGGPFPDGWMHEEWLGIFGQGDGRHTPYLREPRMAYEALKKIWTRSADDL